MPEKVLNAANFPCCSLLAVAEFMKRSYHYHTRASQLPCEWTIPRVGLVHWEPAWRDSWSVLPEAEGRGRLTALQKSHPREELQRLPSERQNTVHNPGVFDTRSPVCLDAKRARLRRPDQNPVRSRYVFPKSKALS